MYIYIKRLFDIIVALLSLLLFVPISILVKISFLSLKDKGGIFFKQERIGKDGIPFVIYKYRSMVHNADELLEEMLKDEKYKNAWNESQKIENDPRITKIGKYLRISSLDELPQILNVLRGEMSIVGPRPLVEGELEAHGGSKLYWKVKPGITGWWASHGRSDVDYDERLKMEYFYVRNLSLKLDVICIYKTIIAVIKHKGVE